MYRSIDLYIYVSMSVCICVCMYACVYACYSATWRDGAILTAYYLSFDERAGGGVCILMNYIIIHIRCVS